MSIAESFFFAAQRGGMPVVVFDDEECALFNVSVARQIDYLKYKSLTGAQRAAFHVGVVVECNERMSRKVELGDEG